MKHFLAILFLFTTSHLAFANQIENTCWKTVSDSSGKIDSIINIYKEHGMLHGKIIKTFQYPKEPFYTTCQHCTGSFKNQPIEGLVFMWGGREIGKNRWNNLRILDPKSGSIYQGKATLIEDGHKLSVRGYIGISLFGRTQTWLKTDCLK